MAQGLGARLIGHHGIARLEFSALRGQHIHTLKGA
jgi:hypothetical protein